ncbi:MAG: hypothetical protein VZQ78_05795, partial [Prevotella sp.]|nr:hypothetical protein [Prevotella sp.]
MERHRFVGGATKKSLTPAPSREGEGSSYFIPCFLASKDFTPLSFARGAGGEAFYALIQFPYLLQFHRQI